eukprot:TRINITY_DN3947_c0_g1_i1.p1 TRINITY_DN3947_c0_g1~~TRINITY_DN3947_c0_g1_i1.p1  ORF type:complete len:138 (-),score=21.80 TRINITY_DN3947_c0_g1_i1:37-426(-)
MGSIGCFTTKVWMIVICITILVLAAVNGVYLISSNTFAVNWYGSGMASAWVVAAVLGLITVLCCENGCGKVMVIIFEVIIGISFIFAVIIFLNLIWTTSPDFSAIIAATIVVLVDFFILYVGYRYYQEI